ncbi:MAG: 4'-phosphopantetheinyl transferase superfamily protein [Burkholderiales bacterium]
MTDDTTSVLIPLPAPAPGVSAWLTHLVRAPEEIAALAALLSAAESARAARFGRPELRDRYVVGRGSLRMLLGARLDLPPQRVVIERGHRGRPFTPQDAHLDFNVSHTRDVALVGLADRPRIGVDIEHRERILNVAGVARKFMSPAEQALLASLADDERRRTLLRLWTCKEAMSKATGDALAAPFRHIDVDLADGMRVRDGPPPYLPARMHLHPVAVPGGFLATVALWDHD